MKKIIQLLAIGLMLISANNITAQDKNTAKKENFVKPYHPEDNAQEKIDALLIKAKKENKNIILQAGGNWCIWCLRFHDFISKNQVVKSNLDKNFLYYHLNFSTENKNAEVFAKYAPEGSKLGYPFFIVLDINGKVLGLQESSSLENGTSYDKDKVSSFLNKYKRK